MASTVYLLRLFMLITLIFSTLSSASFSAPLSNENVPDPLKPWINWVLQDEDVRACPFIYNKTTAMCVWPARLDLVLDNQQGRFSQTWQVYKDSTIRLVGDKKAWPRQVLVNGKAAPVLDINGIPMLKLSAGQYKIEGQFSWNKLPQSLAITPETGLISLRLNGKEIPQPEINHTGRLWLKSEQSTADERDTLDIQVYRKIIDAHPMQLITQIDLRVSGRQRDIELNHALLEGFTPLQLDSKLPTRIDAAGKLQVQLRSGEWRIRLTSRSQQALQRLQMPRLTDKLWPTQEIWVFEARNDLRLVQVEGVNSIDPRQTNLPSAWQTLPAYRMQADKPLLLKQLRRGDPIPEPDKLSLRRDLWLDFDGKAYTARDTIQGTMTQGWRLEALAELQLGRVLLDNEAQFITQHGASQLKGIEVRRGSIDLQAESRYQGERSSLPVNGWQHDFTRVDTTLHLPPGWKLFSAAGVDNTPQTWLQKWTLLDLFLVLITAIAIAHLSRWQWGVFALITLVLIWNETNAPQFIWLNLIAAIALLGVLPQGRFKKMIGLYRYVSLIILVLIIIPFMLNEVRLGLYPQLEKPWFNSDDYVTEALAPASPALEAEADAIASLPQKMQAPMQNLQKQRAMESKDNYSSKSSGKAVLQEMDPKANIQTGPGLPNWQWNQIQLSWSGPVEADERVDLILVSPTMNLWLNLLRVILVLLLTMLIFSHLHPKFAKKLHSFKQYRTNQTRHNKPVTKKTAALNTSNTMTLLFVTVVLPLLLAPIDTVRAEVLPSDAVLQQLKQRLLAPAECQPHCAQIERLSLQIAPELLQGKMRLHAASASSIPLPGNAKIWLPSEVWLNGELAQGLSRSKKGELWLAVPAGSHDILFQGSLANSAQMQLVLPLRPHYVDWQSQAWQVEGVQANGTPSSQLQINRIAPQTSPKSNEQQRQGTNLLPPFVTVERTLRLGLNWTIDTRVQRLSPSANPMLISIPLLAGESLLSENFTVKNNAVRINLAANQNSIQWQSRLAIKDKFTLTAAKHLHFNETWKLEVSPIWHVETKGIPVIQHQQSTGVWLPTWKPWANEQVQFTVSRPKGVVGQTLTINASQLTVNMGKRANDVQLNFSLRSSQGTQHTLSLPDQAQLQRVLINDKRQAIRQNGNKVVLPITPDKQEIQLEWRESNEQELLFKVAPVDLGVASVNNQIQLNVPNDRWILWVGGSQLGPAVLFWGVLLVVLILSIVLGRSQLAPLKTWQWFLLGIGLSQIEPFLMLIVIAWLLLLALREKLIVNTSRLQFNFIQIGLVFLTVFALSSLFGAVAEGLLGQPNMQISGNHSDANQLNWYQDRSSQLLASPWMLSVPLFIYRLLMLLWALWLAFALIGWLRWGWERMNIGGLWREKPPKDNVLAKQKSKSKQ